MRRADADCGARSTTVRPFLAVAVCMLVVFASPVAAPGAFAPVTPPGSAQAVDGFAASQGAWLLGLSSSGSYARTARISRDRGQTWLDVALPAHPNGASGSFSGVVVGPDGAFYLALRYATALSPGVFGRLLRINPADATVSIVSTLPVPDGTGSLSAPGFDAQARPWVAWVPAGSPTLTVARIAGGAATDTHQAPAPTYASANGEVQFRVSGMWVRMGNTAYRLTGGALAAAPRGIPVLEEGSLMIGRTGLSLDGGQTFHNTASVFAVEGNPALLGSQNTVMRRYSPAMFSTTAQSWPNTSPIINRVLPTNGGLVALADQWREPRNGTGYRMLWHAGALTDQPFSTGPTSATFTTWLNQSNAFRAQAGLPPLVGDVAISTAAENHSRYWTLNTPSASVSWHSETPGTPGFTGASPSDRCGFAGAPAFCSEIMLGSIPGWVTSASHRDLIMHPGSLLVGGGVVPGGPSVMDGGQAGNLLVGAVMFPRGAYSGPLQAGGESPDPATACRASGQQVTAPLGTPVSLWVPGGTVSNFQLTPAGGAPLRSCTFSGVLLPDDALLPATTYTASLLWSASTVLAAQPVTWQFTTAPGPTPPPPPAVVPPPPPATVALPPPVTPPPPVAPPVIPPTQASTTPTSSSCVPSLRRVAASVRRPGTIAVRVRTCGIGVVTIGIYRHKPATPAQRRALSRRSVSVREARTLIVRLGTRHLRTGRRALRVTLRAAKPKKLNTTITILAARRR